jgi:GT2 family glycosyltransferase
MKTSAIIVTYNKKEMLKKSLNALLNLNNDIYKVVVINNNSSDDTDKYLENINDDRILYKNLDKNLGGAGGFSKGLEVAYTETEADYFWIMDDDAIAQRDALDKLLLAAKDVNDNFGFLSSSVCYENGEGTNYPDVAHGDWNLLLHRNHLIKLTTASFVSLLFSRKVLTEVGLPISEMFIWGDDFEYTNRINNAIKYPNYFVQDSHITHLSKNVNTTIYNCPEKLIHRYQLMYRNFLYSDKKYTSKIHFIRQVLDKIILSIKVLFRSDDIKFKRFKSVFIGSLSSIGFNPRIKFPNKK